MAFLVLVVMLIIWAYISQFNVTLSAFSSCFAFLQKLVVLLFKPPWHAAVFLVAKVSNTTVWKTNEQNSHIYTRKYPLKISTKSTIAIFRDVCRRKEKEQKSKFSLEFYFLTSSENSNTILHLSFLISRIYWYLWISRVANSFADFSTSGFL